MQKKIQVFISSTYTDLNNERQAAVEAILRSGHIPAGMELFAAGDKSQMEVIKKWIDESDVFLLIMGGRYGSIDPETGNGYVQIEYEYALSKDKPWFACIISDEELENRGRIDYEKYRETRNGDKFRDFRNILKSKALVQFWSDARDIKVSVFQSLGNFSQREDIKGWIKNSIDIQNIILQSYIDRTSSEKFHERSHIQHHLIHQVRDMCLQMLPQATYVTPALQDGQSPQPHPLLRENRHKIVSLLERIAQLFQLLVPPNVRVWACIRDRRADDCYHTFERAGRYNTNRSTSSKPMHKDESQTIQRLKHNFKFNGVCVTITGSNMGPQIWEKQENDNFDEDLSVMLGAVLVKSWDKQRDDWSSRKLVWIIGVCADTENAFSETHIPLMQSCVDMFSMLANIIIRSENLAIL